MSPKVPGYCKIPQTISLDILFKSSSFPIITFKPKGSDLVLITSIV